MTREARHHHQKRSGIQTKGVAGASFRSRMSSHVQKFCEPVHRTPCRCSTSRKPSRLLTNSRKRGAKKDGKSGEELSCAGRGSSEAEERLRAASRLKRMPYEPIAASPKISEVIRLCDTLPVRSVSMAS